MVFILQTFSDVYVYLNSVISCVITAILIGPVLMTHVAIICETVTYSREVVEGGKGRDTDRGCE